MPLRFLMVTTFYPPYSFGGDGIFVQRLSNQLAQRGHTVDVVHCVDSYRLLAGREPDRRADDHPNVTVHGVRSPVGVLSPVATQQTGRPLFKTAQLRELAGKGHDVVHFHNISLFGPKVLEYGRGIKLFTLHEYWLVCPTHMLFKFNRAVCVRPTCLACTLSHRRPPQWWRYTRLLERAVRHVDAFIAPSRFGKQVHERLNLNLVHLPSFVPPAPPLVDATVPGGAKPYFLFVGRLEKLKGLQTLMPQFRGQGEADLLIVGSGSYEAELRGLAVGCHRLKFLGHRSERELQGLYRHARALIVPSICFEMFPLVILEAFRQRTPVIARNIGGMTEMIEESGGGVLYESDEQLATAIDRMLSDESFRLAMGARGHDAYRRKWTVESHLDRYLALIQEIDASKRPGASSSSHVLRDGS
jgi:glycosyltransferase involved in cell wall biosynthesis